MKKLISAVCLVLAGCGSEPPSQIQVVESDLESIHSEYVSRGGSPKIDTVVRGFQYWDGGTCVVVVQQRSDFNEKNIHIYHSYLGHEIDHCRGYAHD